jgi:hypothetical protein
MRFAFATALALLAPACGLKFDVSRIAGLNATFDLARDPEEAIIPECRLVVPPYAPEDSPAVVRLARQFEFRGAPQSVTVDVDARLLEASRSIGTERCTLSRFNWDEFYESVVFDPAEEPFFEALLVELREVRAALGLDDSGYAELLVAFVQSLVYEAGDGLPKHPIAAFADGVGDCDERSALLAGLLAREGYNVCLFLFLEEQHMAVGLRADDIDYRGTGYAYVESTQPSYIGRSPFGWHGTDPDVIEIGDGERGYTPSREQRYLDLAANRAWQVLDDLDEAAENARDWRAGVAFDRLLDSARRGADPAELRRVLFAVIAFAPRELEPALRALAVYAVVATRPDLDAAFEEASALMDPSWDAMFRTAAGWSGGSGIPSRGAP